MLANLTAQLDAALKNITNATNTNSVEAQRLQQEKADLQKQIDQLQQQQQNGQNCYQGAYGTVCQNPQQAQAAQQAQQNQDLLRALQGMNSQNRPGQGQQGGGGSGAGGGNSGGGSGPGSDKSLAPADAAKGQADEAKALADRVCKLNPSSDACTKAKAAAEAAGEAAKATEADQKARIDCLKDAGGDKTKQEECVQKFSDTPKDGAVEKPDRAIYSCPFIREKGTNSKAIDTGNIDIIGMKDIKQQKHTLFVKKNLLTNKEYEIGACVLYKPNQLKKKFTSGECCEDIDCKKKSIRQPEGAVFEVSDNLELQKNNCNISDSQSKPKNQQESLNDNSGIINVNTTDQSWFSKIFGI
jgi:hypothetical protein